MYPLFYDHSTHGARTARGVRGAGQEGGGGCAFLNRELRYYMTPSTPRQFLRTSLTIYTHTAQIPTPEKRTFYLFSIIDKKMLLWGNLFAFHSGGYTERCSGILTGYTKNPTEWLTTARGCYYTGLVRTLAIVRLNAPSLKRVKKGSKVPKMG